MRISSVFKTGLVRNHKENLGSRRNWVWNTGRAPRRMTRDAHLESWAMDATRNKMPLAELGVMQAAKEQGNLLGKAEILLY